MLLTPHRLVKAVATPSTAQQLTATAGYADSAVIQARRTAGNNAGNVFIGISTEDQGLIETIELPPGDSISLLPVPGQRYDLTKLYVDADTATDGVVVLYWSDN